MPVLSTIPSAIVPMKTGGADKLASSFFIPIDGTVAFQCSLQVGLGTQCRDILIGIHTYIQ